MNSLMYGKIWVNAIGSTSRTRHNAAICAFGSGVTRLEGFCASALQVLGRRGVVSSRSSIAGHELWEAM